MIVSFTKINRLFAMFEPSNQSSKSPKGENETNILLTLLKWLLFVVALPPILNFGALQNERQQLLKENTTMFDIGFGQKLYMSCKGKGKCEIKSTPRYTVFLIFLLRHANNAYLNNISCVSII